MTALIKSLDHNNHFISWQIDKIDQSLQDRNFDPNTAERTKIWLPQIDSVRRLSKEMYTYLHSLKTALMIRARIVADSTNVPKGWGDKDPAYGLFEKSEIKKELSRKIAMYHKAILNAWSPLNPLLPEVVKEDVKRDIPGMVTNIPEDLVRGFNPANTTTAMAYILLDQIENNLLLTEYAMIRYAYIHTDVIREGNYDKFSVLIGANSSYLKAGQTLIINAGVGQFSVAAHPKVFVNDIPLIVDNGVAEYHTKVGNVPGKHTIPIRIDFVRPDGSPMTVKKDVQYEIAP